jgi:tetratricopeptide (TPR) repeat protein
MVDIAKREFEKGGVDSVRASYLTMKETYYGGDAYNFKPGTLNEIAEWLADEKNDNDAAIAVMKLNIEQAPDVAYSYNLLGRIQAGAGRNQEAIESLKKAIELNPDDKWARRILDRLQAGK